MKVSLNWIKDYTPIKLGIKELVEKIGAQIGAVEGTVNLAERYKDILIAKVINCNDHPNADRLHVCKIDDGGVNKNVPRDGQGYIQVVCGAPNVREGMVVAWLPPGSTVPNTFDKESLVLESREIRGEVSNGMLASPKELAISDSHEGLLEIDENAQPGQSFSEVYQLDDYIIDIENKMFTHRPDCFGQLGVAREVAGIMHQKFTSPAWYLNGPEDELVQKGETLPLLVDNQLPHLVPRFMAVSMGGITIQQSPIWLQSHLSRLGIRPINNIVDITNYMMILTGQPLHAYDYDKVRALDESADHATLTIRFPEESEKIILLNGKEIMPRQKAIMIATVNKLIGIGGVMGGAETEVDAHTKNIILECATFDMYSIRRTAMTHGLFTDAVTRFTKGQSPFQNDRVIAKSVKAIFELLDTAQLGSEVIDDNHTSNEQKPVLVTAQFINERLGFELSSGEMKTLLENVEFHIEENDSNLIVSAPFWRTDIESREDVVEEIGRLYGYDHLPLVLPRRDILPATKDNLLEFRFKISDILRRSGANEVLTYNFVHGNLLEKMGQDKSQAFRITNALSPDLQYYRLSLTPNLLEKVHPNIKAGYDEFVLFEINKAHSRLQLEEGEDKLPKEFNALALVVAANDQKAGQRAGASYYGARKYLDFLAARLGMTLRYTSTENQPDFQVSRPFNMQRSALVMNEETGTMLGIIGELTPEVIRHLKLPRYCAAFEVDIEGLLSSSKKTPPYHALPRFPKVEQDICLKVGANTQYQDLIDFLLQQINDNKPESTVFSLKLIDIFQRPEDEGHKQITFRLSIASYVKTMTDEEVNSLLERVAVSAKEKIGAERI